MKPQNHHAKMYSLISKFVVTGGSIKLSKVGLGLLMGCCVLGVREVSADDGLAGPEEMSVFSPVEIGRTETKAKILLEMNAVWEKDATRSGQGMFANEAYDMDFNLLVVDDVMYAYSNRERPGGAYPHWILRRFDINTGEELTPFQGNFPTEITTGDAYGFVRDDAGNIVLMAVYSNDENTTRQKKLEFRAYLLNPENGQLTTIFNKIYQKQETIHYFIRSFGWQNIDGDITTGNFTLRIGTHHKYTSDKNGNYFPSIVEVKFSKEADEPEFSIKRLAAGEYHAEESHMPGKEGIQHMIMYQALDNGSILAQTFGQSENSKIHSPLLLYTDMGDTDDRSVHTPYPLLSQTDAITASSSIAPSEEQCFGFQYLTLAGEQLLIVPTAYDSPSGIRFTIGRLPADDAVTPLTTAFKLWDFPNGASFPQTAGNPDFYRHPRFAIADALDSETEPDAVKAAASAPAPSVKASKYLYAYMPGALLAKYRLNLVHQPTSSLDLMSPDDSVSLPKTAYSLSGRTLTITPADANTAVNYALTTPSGHLVISGSTTSSTSINLNSLSPGIYLFTLHDITAKLLLR